MTHNKEDNSTIDNLTYAYTPGSNRLASVTDAINTTLEDWDAESSTFAYDGNGNIVEMLENGAPAISSIKYDHRNLPVSLLNRNGDLVTYRYNAAGQRIYKRVGSQTPEYYLMDGDQTVAVYRNSAVRYWNILANGVAGRYEPGSGSKFYYLKDHLGSTRAVVDAAGNIKDALDYYPFGLLMPGRDYLSGERTKEKFTGKEQDTETNFYWSGPGRYYFPALGRWLSIDPILSSNTPLKLIRLGVLNESPYAYVSNNPIIYIDQFGFVKWNVVGKGTLKLLGGAVATGVSGYALVQTGGGAALFGATLGFTTGLATISLGLGEIISGFSDKEFPLSEGFIVSVASELGVDRKTALRIAMAWDLLSVGQSAANVVSKTGTTLDELSLLLNAENLSEDIKAQIQEYLKSQEKEKEREKKEKKQQEEEKKEEEKEKD